MPPGDDDCDGWATGDEDFYGTLPFTACPATSTANDEEPDPWPPDFDDSQTVNLLDLLPFKQHFGAVDPQDPLYEARYDLQADGDIDIQDLLPFKQFFMLSCA